MFYEKKEEHVRIRKAEFVEKKKVMNIERAQQFRDTNIPPFNKIIPPQSHYRYEKYIKRRFLNRLIAEHMNPKENYIPRIIFDFRFTNDVTNPIAIKSFKKQYDECIPVNMECKEPFKICFYNYSKESLFHKKSQDIERFLDANLIDVYEHSYLQDFNREDLIYLSSDASREMEDIDPTKTYIIGSIIDDPDGQYKFATLTTAKREGIKTLKFPLDRYLRYSI